MTDSPRRPPLDTVASFVRLQRAMLHWKQATLASKAKVSLSTVQRVERGKGVADNSLERLALALNQPKEAFTVPRIPLGEQEALQNLIKSLSWMEGRVEVPVAPLKREAQLRELASCDMMVMDSDLGDAVTGDLAELREWFDLIGFVRAQDGAFLTKRERDFPLRRLYWDAFAAIQDVERRHKAVCLVGNYQASSNLPALPNVKIAVIAMRSRERNPASAKITALWCEETVDARAAFSADEDVIL